MYPSWGSIHCSYKLNNIRAKIDLLSIEDCLNDKRKEAKERENHLNKQWKEVKDVGQSLRNSITKFDDVSLI